MRLLGCNERICRAGQKKSPNQRSFVMHMYEQGACFIVHSNRICINEHKEEQNPQRDTDANKTPI